MNYICIMKIEQIKSIVKGLPLQTIANYAAAQDPRMTASNVYKLMKADKVEHLEIDGVKFIIKPISK